MDFIPRIDYFESGEKVRKENLPARRKELIDILAREEYGFLPPAPEKVEAEIISCDKKIAAGHAICEKIMLSFKTPNGIFSFPFDFYKRIGEEKRKIIIMLNFTDISYHKYLPVEEIIDRGFSIAVMKYNDITSDDADFSSGLAAHFPHDSDDSFGKISLWAYSASRIIDYLYSLPETDRDTLALCGHSRLGKTALWCAANDERVKFVYSNDSGCSGASYERIKTPDAETLARITARFPYWFCENYKKYANDPDKRPFDQHFLIGAIAPRYVLIGSASLDNWAGQYSEQLSCIGASPLWEIAGVEGFSGGEAPCKVGERFFGGRLAYHLRDGIHFFSRNDHNAFMDFILKNSPFS